MGIVHRFKSLCYVTHLFAVFKAGFTLIWFRVQVAVYGFGF